MVKLFLNFIYGISFGITQIVPGVSGGTVAIIMGFYDELIDTINNFTKDYKRCFKFILPFLFGIGMGMVLFSSLVSFMLENFSFPTMLFFVGLIAGIAPAVYGKIKETGSSLKLQDIILILIPIVVLVAISHLSSPTEPDPYEVISNAGIPYMAFLFFVGALAAAALIIPGVSGSFILLLLGVYHIATYSLSSIRELLSDITNVSLMLDILKIMLPLGLGVIVGGLAMARLVGKLLENYTRIVYSLILGLIIGSIYALMREPMVYESGTAAPMVIAAVISFAIGFITSFMLGKKKM